MLLAGIVALWIALPAALHFYLSRVQRPPVLIIAGSVTAWLWLFSGVQHQCWQIDYVFETFQQLNCKSWLGVSLISIATNYLLVTIMAFLIHRFARCLPKTLFSIAFWVFHVGRTPSVMVILMESFQVQEGQTDKPGLYDWYNLTSEFAEHMINISAVLMVILTCAALMQSALKWLGR